MSGDRVRWDEHPITLVPTAWLARLLGKHRSCVQAARHCRGVELALSSWEVYHFPDLPSTWHPWVTGWGVDRVRAYLARWSPATLPTFEAAVAAGFDRGADLALCERRAIQALRAWHAKQRIQNPYVRRARHDIDWDAHPLGFLPDRVLGPIVGFGHDIVAAVRKDHGIEAQTSRRYPFPATPARWYPWVDAWGVDRVRAYVAQHLPHLADKLEAALEARGKAPAPVKRVRAPKVVPKPVAPPAPSRRPSVVPSRDREPVVTRMTPEQEAEAVRQFLAKRRL